MNSRMIVSTLNKDGKILGSELWDIGEPKGLGHPFRYCLEKTKDGVRIRDLATLSVKEVPDKTLKESQISLNGGNLRLQIHPLSATTGALDWSPSAARPEKIIADRPGEFKKTSLSVVGMLLVILLINKLIPSPKQEELVPPQFAKIIMKPMKSSDSQASESHRQPVNVVQTFKSEAVKKSTQALLHASVVSLLAKSTPFSVAKSKSSLGALFSPIQINHLKSNDLLASADRNPLSVGTLGGSGKNSGGYSNGEHAGIAKQGDGFVSLNTPEAMVDEGLSKDEVGKVIHAHIAEVRYCYESAMIKNPDVQGKLVVHFVIHSLRTTFGSVKTAKVNTSTVDDTILDQCIISRLTQWKFPKPRGGVEVAVAYPFIFKSLGK